MLGIRVIAQTLTTKIKDENEMNKTNNRQKKCNFIKERKITYHSL